MDKRRVTVVDADSVAYRSAAASEERSILVTHNPTLIQKSFKNRTEFKTLLKSKNKLSKIDEYCIQDVQEASPAEYSFHTIKSQLEKIRTMTKADQMLIIVGDKSTYRESLDLPSLYKGSRADTLRPLLLKDAKNYLIAFHSAEVAKDIESDDLVIIRAKEFAKEGYDVTIASIDKDNRQCDGFNVFEYNKEEDGLYYLDGHSLSKEGDKVVGSGVGFLAFQLVWGDKTDCYKPCELANIKYGEVSAYNDLKDCKSAKDYLEVVKTKYKEWYPEPVTYTAWNGKECTKDWKEILQMYFTCAYMLRSFDDKANVEEFFNGYGVQL